MMESWNNGRMGKVEEGTRHKASSQPFDPFDKTCRRAQVESLKAGRLRASSQNPVDKSLLLIPESYALRPTPYALRQLLLEPSFHHSNNLPHNGMTGAN